MEINKYYLLFIINIKFVHYIILYSEQTLCILFNEAYYFTNNHNLRGNISEIFCINFKYVL